MRVCNRAVSLRLLFFSFLSLSLSLSCFLPSLHRSLTKPWPGMTGCERRTLQRVVVGSLACVEETGCLTRRKRREMEKEPEEEREEEGVKIVVSPRTL